MDFVSDDTKKKYPALNQLLGELDKKKNVLYKSQSNTKAEKINWMKAETTYQSINKVLSSKLIESYTNKLTSEEVEFWNSFNKSWRATETLPSFGNHQKVLSSDLLPNIQNIINEERNKWEMNCDYLFKALELYLKTCCSELTELYDGTDYSKSHQVIIDHRSLHLHDLIKESNKNLREISHQLKRVQIESFKTFIGVVEILLKCSKSLEELFNKYQLKLQPMKDTGQVNCQLRFVQKLALDIKCKRLQLNTETYSAVNIQALTKLSKILKARFKADARILAEVTQELNSYKMLGSEFEKIVESYFECLKEVEKQSWILHKLNNSSTK